MKKNIFGIEVSKKGKELEIKCNWINVYGSRAGAFVFCSLLVYIASFCVARNIYEVIIFLCIFGLPLTYLALIHLINKTILRIDEKALSIRHKPLPWPGNITIPLADIRKFLCRTKTIAGKYGARRHNSMEIERKNGKTETILNDVERGDLLIVKKQIENLIDTEIPLISE